MAQTQRYIGAPNGVVVCVDRHTDGNPSGVFFHSYSEHPAPFDGYQQLVARMEWLFDWLQFPHRGTNERYFVPEKGKQYVMPAALRGRQPEREKIVSDENLLSRHGEIGTFIVRVQHRQNSSWQGRITWMEEDKTVAFRSVWEMIKLMENAVDSVEAPAQVDEVPAWFEGEKDGNESGKAAE